MVYQWKKNQMNSTIDRELQTLLKYLGANTPEELQRRLDEEGFKIDINTPKGRRDLDQIKGGLRRSWGMDTKQQIKEMYQHTRHTDTKNRPSHTDQNDYEINTKEQPIMLLQFTAITDNESKIYELQKDMESIQAEVDRLNAENQQLVVISDEAQAAIEQMNQVIAKMKKAGIHTASMKQFTGAVCGSLGVEFPAPVDSAKEERVTELEAKLNETHGNLTESRLKVVSQGEKIQNLNRQVDELTTTIQQKEIQQHKEFIDMDNTHKSELAELFSEKEPTHAQDSNTIDIVPIASEIAKDDIVQTPAGDTATIAYVEPTGKMATVLPTNGGSPGNYHISNLVPVGLEPEEYLEEIEEDEDIEITQIISKDDLVQLPEGMVVTVLEVLGDRATIRLIDGTIASYHTSDLRVVQKAQGMAELTKEEEDASEEGRKILAHIRAEDEVEKFAKKAGKKTTWEQVREVCKQDTRLIQHMLESARTKPAKEFIARLPEIAAKEWYEYGAIDAAWVPSELLEAVQELISQ